MSSPLLTMHRLFRRLQQKNRFIGRAPHSGLSLSETHFILELQANQKRSIQDLSNLLGINQSSCSRIAQNLEKLGFMKLSPAIEDSRRKVLSITPKGSAVIAKIDQVSDTRLAGFAARLSPSEHQALVQLFSDIADGYGHPEGIARRGENPYRVQQRRITRCFGLLGDHVFESGLSSSQWQALSEIVLCPIRPQPTELAELLGIAQNSISSILSLLERRGFIRRVSHHSDKRSSVVHARSAGVKACEEIERRATSDLARSLKNYSKAEVERATAIVSRFVGEFDPTYPPLLPAFALRKIDKPEGRRASRGYIARELVQAGQEDNLPGLIIADDSDVYSLSSEEQELAVIEIASRKRGQSIVCAGWSSSLSPFALGGAVNAALFACEADPSTEVAKRLNFEPLRLFLRHEQVRY